MSKRIYITEAAASLLDQARESLPGATPSEAIIYLAGNNQTQATAKPATTTTKDTDLGLDLEDLL